MSSYSAILITPIEYLKGVGPKKGNTLKDELSIFTFKDLLEHYPFRYIDKTKITPISSISHDTPFVQIKGKLSGLKTFGQQRATRLVATINDGTGSIDLVWFKGITYMKKMLQADVEYLVFGRPSIFNNRFNISHPEIEPLKAQVGAGVELENRLMPVYSSTEKLRAVGLESKGLYKLIQTLFEKINPQRDIPEILSPALKEEYKLIDRWQAFKNIHIPESHSIISKSRYRLKFEEFFFIQLQIYRLKLFRQHKYKGFLFESVGEKFNHFYHNELPFDLTNAQKRVLRDIRRDTAIGKHMNRLLQGDVGSGKTIVGLLTMLLALDNNFQAALMAPTEILAQQHFNGISELLKNMDIKVEILTGSKKGKKRRLLLEELEQGNIDILIGTHALIEDPVVFKNLGMVIIDEQHRFGVAQRAKLWKKNTQPPHVLVMTATPIPRTLAMTVYGDLDVSVIDELPPGRKPIKTMHFYDSARLRVFQFMKDEIAKGRQVYLVYPLIQESEKLDYKDLMDGYESISRAFPLPEYRVSIVHGKMKPADKEAEMQRFKNHETQIMVATTVIEVGVDVPNASVMIIESSERFGLSQLHQLRGRVGRGGEQSYCILITGNKLSNEGKRRIQTMVETNDGFRISEVDMEIRGPGDLQGTQQSGVLNMKLADLMKDQKVLAIARNAAADLMEVDPMLNNPENQKLRLYMQSEKSEGSQWSRIS